jgi:heat shock protein HtpX
MGNQIRTGLLLMALTILIMVIGQLIGGRQGMLIALIFATGMNFFSYWFSDKLVLKMYGASEVKPQEAPEIHQIVRTLTQRANLPMPKIYIIPQDSPNAFATGRNPQHAAVAVTSGLVKLMPKEEITGVIAHELAHVKNRDILIGSIAATMAGAIMMIANMARWSAFMGGGSSSNEDNRGVGSIGLILMSIIAPLAAVIIQMAISRSREYHADAVGASFAGTPEGLARALEKLDAFAHRRPMEANPTTAHMFIVNPLSRRSLMSLFSTHPPIDERIARLRGIRPDFPGRGGDGISTNKPPFDEGKAFWDRLSE